MKQENILLSNLYSLDNLDSRLNVHRTIYSLLYECIVHPIIQFQLLLNNKILKIHEKFVYSFVNVKSFHVLTVFYVIKTLFYQ